MKRQLSTGKLRGIFCELSFVYNIIFSLYLSPSVSILFNFLTLYGHKKKGREWEASRNYFWYNYDNS